MFPWHAHADRYAWPGNSCLSLLVAVLEHLSAPVPPEFGEAMRKSEDAARRHAVETYGGVLVGYERLLERHGWERVPAIRAPMPFDIVLGVFGYAGGYAPAEQPAVVREDHRLAGFTEDGLRTVEDTLSLHGKMRFGGCPQH